MYLVTWHRRRNSTARWERADSLTVGTLDEACEQVYECLDMNEQHGWRKFRVTLVTLD